MDVARYNDAIEVQSALRSCSATDAETSYEVDLKQIN